MRAALAVLTLLVLAPPATAGSVEVVYYPGDFKTTGPRTTVRYIAADGEANRLTVTAVDGGFRLADEVAVQAGPGCEQAGEREALCRPTYGGAEVAAFLSDGDDRATATTPVTIDGGPGIDDLTGSPGIDDLDGGPGADVVAAGPGDDTIRASGGGGEPGDRLDGGEGSDTLSFALSGVGARVDLAAGRAVSAGEATAITAFERVEGSAADDVLLGGPAADTLDGGEGRDTVDGREGDDTVQGGFGRDVVRGGAGDDLLDPPIELSAADQYLDNTEDGGRNRLECGAGDDRVDTIHDLDAIAADCERFAGFRLVADLRRPARAHVRLPRQECYDRGGCTDVLKVDTVRGPDARPRVRTRVATRRYVRKTGRRLRLDREARATLRRERARRVLVRFGGGDGVRFVLRLSRR